MFLVDLLLQFHGLLVERVVFVGENFLAGLVVEEIFMNSLAMEFGVLVGQGVLEVLSFGKVHLNSITVELVALVPQSFSVVRFVCQVSLGVVPVKDALGSLVVRTFLVCKRFLQVLGFAKVLQDGKLMELAVLVHKRLMVNLKIFEFLGSSLPCGTLRLLVLGQKNVAFRGFSVGGRVSLNASGVGRQGCLRGGSLQIKFVE